MDEQYFVSISDHILIVTQFPMVFQVLKFRQLLMNMKMN